MLVTIGVSCITYLAYPFATHVLNIKLSEYYSVFPGPFIAAALSVILTRTLLVEGGLRTAISSKEEDTKITEISNIALCVAIFQGCSTIRFYESVNGTYTGELSVYLLANMIDCQ